MAVVRKLAFSCQVLTVIIYVALELGKGNFGTWIYIYTISITTNYIRNGQNPQVVSSFPQ
jgi:hypothetical protein